MQIDVESGDLMDAVDEVGLPADADFVRRTAEHLAGTPGVVFALEFGSQGDLVDEFVTNLNGYCLPSPTVPDLQQLAQVSEGELGTVGAVEEDLCYLTFTTTELDDNLGRFDEIAATLRLT